MTAPTDHTPDDRARAADQQFDLTVEEREAMGLTDETEVAENAYARILLLGPPKSGKTTCVAKTAPKPLIINCDGPSAPKGAAKHGAKFLTLHVSNRPTWNKAVVTALKLAADGKVETIMVDTISLLCDTLLDDIRLTLDGFDKWNELSAQLSGGINKLMHAEAHLFVNAHMQPGVDGAAGILPVIQGSSKTRIPGLLDDWIMLDVKAGRTPERQFLVGPQDYWNASGRNVRRSCAVPATVPELFAELGIPL